MSQKHYSSHDITISQVLDLVRPRIKKEANGRGQMQIYCPIHEKEIIDVNLEQGFKCWQNCPDCPAHAGGHGPQLYQLFNPGLSFCEACDAIGNRIGVLPTNKRSFSEFAPKQRVESSQMASVDERDKTYRALLTLLPLVDKHKKDLIKRGMSEGQIATFGARSMPACGIRTIPQKLIAMGCHLEGVPLFAKDEKGWRLCSVKGKSGFFIPYYDINGKIQQLQIRYDVQASKKMTEDELSEAKKMRYRWGSSAGQPFGCAATNDAVFWGVPNTNTKKTTVFVTEGGLKATVSSCLSGDWFVAIPGVSCFTAFRSIMKVCKKNKLKVVEAFDMDGKLRDNERIVRDDIREKYVEVVDAKGNSRQVKRSVKCALEKLYEIAKEEGVTMTQWTWDPNFKGIDDYLYAEVKSGGVAKWNGTENVDISEDDDDEVLSVCIPDIRKIVGLPTLKVDVNKPFIPVGLPTQNM